MVSLISHQTIDFTIQNEIWDLPKPEAKKQVVLEDGQEAPAEEAKEEEEGGKAKFNKFDYTWTKSKEPKNLA